MFVTRSFEVNDFNVNDEGNRVTGHAAVFGQTTNIADCFYEVIERGAFDECDLSDVMFLVNHIQDKIPMARSRTNSGNSTMSLQVDEKGLFIDASLDVENNSESKSVYSAVKRGDMDGMSFAFFIKEQTWENLDSKMPTRRIKKIKKVSEVSVVNRPAYSGTSINARSEEVTNAQKEIESLRKKNNNSSDELELQKLKLKLLSYK